jgi:hypothetical protein
VKDYSFKINILAGNLERGVLAPVDVGSLDDSGTGFGSGSDSNYDGGAPPVVTTSA